MTKHTQSIDNKIISRIYGKKRGWVFTPGNFKDLGSRSAIDMTLMRYKEKGTIRKLARGLYDYPKVDPILGFMPPSTDNLARALAGRDATKVQPSGAHAANLLGLTTQVPMKVSFLTDGPAKKITIGKMVITLTKTTSRNMATAGRMSGTVIQALRWIGKRHVDDGVVAKLRRTLDAKDVAQLAKDIGYAPIWIADIIRQLSGQCEGSQ
jgi:hypothetical protein